MHWNSAERLQNHSQTLAGEFSASLLSQINQSNHYRARKAHDAQSVDIAELAVVDKVDFEDTLAVNAMVHRLSEEHEELQALRCRLYASWLGELICEERLPVGIAMVCQSLRLTIEPLAIDLTLRELVYQTFEESLGRQLPTWYATMNSYFRAQATSSPFLSRPKCRWDSSPARSSADSVIPRGARSTHSRSASATR